MTYDGFKNCYSFLMEEKMITFVPLSPRQTYEDQLKIKKEFVQKEREKKMREKENKERKEKEEEESFSEK